MQVPLQITLRNIPHSDALEERIRRKVSKLEPLNLRITSFGQPLIAPSTNTIDSQSRSPEPPISTGS